MRKHAIYCRIIIIIGPTVHCLLSSIIAIKFVTRFRPTSLAFRSSLEVLLYAIYKLLLYGVIYYLRRIPCPAFCDLVNSAFDLYVLCTGNDNLHWLTSGRRQRLRVDLADFDGNSRYAEYDDFAVGSALSKYTLHSLGNYAGNASQCGACCCAYIYFTIR